MAWYTWEESRPKVLGTLTLLISVAAFGLALWLAVKPDYPEEVLYVDTDSNVGIGVVDPDYKLEVAGKIKGSDLIMTNGEITTDQNNPITLKPYGTGSVMLRGNHLGITSNTGSTDTAYRVHVNNDAAQSQYNTFIQQANALATDWVMRVFTTAGATVNDCLVVRGNNRVGIGASNPSSKLQVSSLTETASIPTASFDCHSAGTGVVINHVNDTLNRNALSVNTGGVSKMVVRGDGNVGVGSSTPGEKLDVAGNIRGNNLIMNNGSVTTVASSNNSITLNPDGIGNVLIAPGSGNVGIGAGADPNYKFAVKYTGEYNSFIDHTLSPAGVYDWVFRVRVGGTINPIVIRGSGNVGIRTDDASEALDVVGNIKGNSLILNNGSIVTPASTNGSITLNPDGTGNVGVGTTNPATAKLVVNGGVAESGTEDIEAYWDISTGIQSGTSGASFSIFATNAIVADVFTVVSDSRIKNNTSAIDDGAALSKLRLVEPTEYNYIDVVQKTPNRVYGFIAQQVRAHFPEAVSLTKGFVPDVYQRCTVDATNGTIAIPNARTGRVRVKFYAGGERELDVVVVSPGIAKYSSAEIVAGDLHEGQVFVYGYEVDDFHTLNKDYLFTINFAATQELDRQLQAEKQSHETTKASLVSVKKELDDLKALLLTKGIL